MARNQGVVDILMLDEPETFVVNTAADPPEVVETWVAAPATKFGTFENPAGNSVFDYKDNLVLLSFAWVLPYCFHVSTGTPNVALSWQEIAGADFAVPEMADGSGLFLPLTGVEIPLAMFLEHTGGLGTGGGGELFVGGGAISISMIGVPAILNTVELEIQMMLKVLHNLPMTA